MEISGDEGDAVERLYEGREWGGGGNLRQAEAVVQSFQGGGSWNSRMVRMVTLYVLVRRVAFCPSAGWGGGTLTGEG